MESDTISTRGRALALQALQMAIDQRDPPPGLLHHTDQGSAYTGELTRVSRTLQNGLTLPDEVSNGKASDLQ